MEITRKIINFTIAILAIIACFQIIQINGNNLFSFEDTEIKECRTNIVDTLDSKKQYVDYALDIEKNVTSGDTIAGL